MNEGKTEINDPQGYNDFNRKEEEKDSNISKIEMVFPKQHHTTNLFI